jgi:IPT/TIG domain
VSDEEPDEAPDEEPEPEPEVQDEPDPEEPVPTVTSILPNNVKVGGEDLVLSVYGTGFTENTVILFNNGEEPTEFVDASRVTTIVKPSTASGPAIVPVTVKGAADVMNFGFTPEDPDDPNTYPDSDSPIGGGPLV